MLGERRLEPQRGSRGCAASRETDDSISGSTWCYVTGIGYYTTQQLLHSTPTPSQDASGQHLSMPSSGAPFSALAYVVKLTFSGRIPTLGSGGGSGIPTGWAKVANVTSGLVLDGGGNVAYGSISSSGLMTEAPTCSGSS